MAKRIKFCPKCMNIIRKNDEKCTSCGLLVSEMQKAEEERLEKEDRLFDQAVEEREKEAEAKTGKVNKKKTKASEVETAVDTTDEKNDEQKDAVESNDNSMNSDQIADTENDDKIGKHAENSSENVRGEMVSASKRHKHKKKKQPRPEDTPQYTIDEDGNFDIDTKDVTFLEGIEAPTYSVKKARGDSPVLEKIKWWEIYKWADRWLARRKIMKEVNKAARKIPYGINKVTMIILCTLFGWIGVHNFYAKNNKKGWTVLAFDTVVAVVLSVPVLYKIMGVFVGGGLAFTVLMMWFLDFIDLLMNRYKYRISKEEFISNLNVKTRANLSKKYIYLDKTVFKAKEQKRIDKINNKGKKKLKQKKEKIDHEK